MFLVIGVRAVSDWRAAQPPNRAQADALFLSIDGFAYRHLKAHFPSDAEAFLDLALAGQARGASGPEMAAASTRFFADFRQRHVAAVEAAPDAALIAFLEEQAEMFRRLSYDPALCSRVAALGTGSLTPEDTMRFLAVGIDGSAQYAAMHAGVTTPVPRSPPTKAEFAALGVALAAAFASSAAPADGLARLTAASADDLELCPTYLVTLDTLITARFSGADKFRAMEAAAILNVP